MPVLKWPRETALRRIMVFLNTPSPCLQPDNLPGVVSLLLDLMLNERSYREPCRREAQESRKAVQVEKARGEEDVAEADRWWGARCAELEQEKDELERKASWR